MLCRDSSEIEAIHFSLERVFSTNHLDMLLSIDEFAYKLFANERWVIVILTVVCRISQRR